MKKLKNKAQTTAFFDRIEKTVNYLPDPIFLFFILAATVIVVSWFASVYNVSVVHPGTGDKVFAENLVSKEGLRRMLTDMVKNFVEFPPLGIVLVALIGIGVAEKSGFFSAALRQMVALVPKKLVVPTLMFAGVNASMLADAGLVILPALGAIVFLSLKRNPLAGLVGAFAAVTAGFSANLLVTAIDPLLSGFTDSAAKIVDASYQVYPTANYYFMFVSTFIVTAIVTFVTVKIIEPRLGAWNKLNEHELTKSPETSKNIDKLSKKEKRALIFSIFSFFLIGAVIILLTLPENAVLRDTAGTIQPLFRSIVAWILIIFLISGMVYGMFAGTIKSGKGLAKMIGDSLSSMGGYIILAFSAGQFIAYFNWSNLGIITAVKGAEFLQSVGLEGLPLLSAFFVFTTFMNIFIYSASAKWALFAPVFVPMFMLMGFSPETTQLVYRVGDSITNIITPLLPYFPVVLGFAKKYQKDINLGKLISLLTPYSIALFFLWGAVLILWLFLGFDQGPNAPLHYTP